MYITRNGSYFERLSKRVYFLLNSCKRCYCNVSDYSMKKKYNCSELTSLKKAFFSSPVRTRELLTSITLPTRSTVSWVQDFLGLPWTIKGESYLNYQIGMEIYDWLGKGNAETLSGNQYVHFCRALNHVATHEQTANFILNTLSPRIISGFAIEQLYHFLALLLRHVGTDIPEGLREAIRSQIDSSWKSFLLPEDMYNNQTFQVKLSRLSCCLRDAKILGISLREIVFENHLSFGYFINLAQMHLMSSFELFLQEDCKVHNVSLKESMKFQGCALQSAKLTRIIPEMVLPQLSFLESNILIEPILVENFLEYFDEMYHKERNPTLRGLLDQSRYQLCTMLTIYHIRKSLKMHWIDEHRFSIEWNGWKKIATCLLYDSTAGSALYPIIRLLGHLCFIMRHRNHGHRTCQAITKYIFPLLELLWQLADSAEFMKICKKEAFFVQSTQLRKKCCHPHEIASNYRHFYLNNAKVLDLRLFFDDIGRSLYLRWITPSMQLSIMKHRNFPHWQSREGLHHLKYLRRSLNFCFSSIIDNLRGDPLSWHAYVALHCHCESAPDATEKSQQASLANIASEWITNEPSIITLINALRDGARAGLHEDAVVGAIITKLQHTSIKTYSFDEISKLCLLFIHIGSHNGYKELPKALVFGIFNRVYTELQDSRKLASHAHVLPDVLHLLSSFKINQQTLAKVGEVCHLMMHYSSGISKVSTALVEVFTLLVLPPSAKDSCEDIRAGRILPYNTLASTNQSWLDKAQVEKFIERSLKAIDTDDPSKRCWLHSVSDIINLCELCITLRHNSTAVDKIINLSCKYSEIACEIETYRLAFTFGKPCAVELGQRLKKKIDLIVSDVPARGVFLCDSAKPLTLSNLLPVFASLTKHGIEKDQEIAKVVLKNVLANLPFASSRELRFLLDLSRSEGSVMEKLVDRETFLCAQKGILQCVQSRIWGHTVNIETVVDAVMLHIGVSHVCFDAEMHSCLKWISLFVSNTNSANYIEHLVSIIRMMAQSGYRDEFILRRTLERFMQSNTKNAYHVISILSSLRKLDIHDLYDRSECSELIRGMCQKLQVIPSLSGRLVASLLTSLSVLVQATIGASEDIRLSIMNLFKKFADVLRKEASSMDCITISAIIVACARLNLTNFQVVFSNLFQRATYLDWAKYPKQAVHFILGAAEIEPTQDILTYLLFSEHVALAIRCILDHSSCYKNLHDAVHLIASRVPWMYLHNSPVAKLVLAPDND